MITVCAVTGVDPIGHMEAIRNTQLAIPHFTRMEFKYISGLTLQQYSVFIVKKLHEIIETQHVLICQADGYGRYEQNWSEEFLEYDFIGAPFPTGEVGNGGFSLRSHAFLRASSTLPEPDIAEDAYLCQFNRPHLESLGMKFAPLEIAQRFSFEHPVEGHPWDPKDSFGFHGSWNK